VQQGATGGSRGPPGATGRSRGPQGATGGSRGPQGAAGGHRGSRGPQGATGGHRGQQGAAGGHRGPQGAAGGHNPWKCPMVPALPSLSPPSFPLHLPPLHAVVFLLFGPRSMTWLPGEDPGRGPGATGEAEPNLPPSTLPLPPPPLGANFTHPPPPPPPCAQQANQAISVCHATWGPGGGGGGGGWWRSRQAGPHGALRSL